MTSDTRTPIQQFDSLASIKGLAHGFSLRHPGLDVAVDREIALDRLRPVLDQSLRSSLDISLEDCWFGEQVHGSKVQLCPPHQSPMTFPATDGLIATQAGSFLGIYVADCCAVFLADPVERVCGLLHSGRKGSEQRITRHAIDLMITECGTDPADLIVQLSPCIRPPAYDVDFAAWIRQDCAEAGVPADQVFDDGVCTSRDPERFYSYRTEKGKTGRMLAVIGWRSGEV